MIIDRADMYGLAQLHQLRGRIGRGGTASTCFLITSPNVSATKDRLQAMASTSDGFKIAEYDLAMLVAVNELAYAPIDLIIEQCVKEYSFKGKGKIELSKKLVTCYLVFCHFINGFTVVAYYGCKYAYRLFDTP